MPIVSPQARCCRTLVVFMFCEAFGEEIVGKFPCLLESIVNFKVDLSIVLVVCEIVFIDH